MSRSCKERKVWGRNSLKWRTRNEKRRENPPQYSSPFRKIWDILLLVSFQCLLPSQLFSTCSFHSLIPYKLTTETSVARRLALPPLPSLFIMGIVFIFIYIFSIMLAQSLQLFRGVTVWNMSSCIYNHYSFMKLKLTVGWWVQAEAYIHEHMQI